jgi:hypothetical protein
VGETGVSLRRWNSSAQYQWASIVRNSHLSAERSTGHLVTTHADHLSECQTCLPSRASATVSSTPAAGINTSTTISSPTPWTMLVSHRFALLLMNWECFRCAFCPGIYCWYLSNAENWIDREDRRIISPWLSPLNFKAGQSEFLQKRQEGTGQWFLQSQEFTDWRDGTSEMLWCPGSRESISLNESQIYGLTIPNQLVRERPSSRTRSHSSQKMMRS